MKQFTYTIPCSRAATTAGTDEWGNPIGEVRAAVSFEAVFAAPDTRAGSEIVDGVLRETTITKPTLMIDRRTANAAAVAPGALRSGDKLTVNGQTGWEVDGDPADYLHPWTGWQPPLWVELRKSVG